MMNGRRNLDMVLAVCVFLAALAGPAGAVTIYVDPNGSADFTTIQGAINDANDYDAIEVAPATYNEAINFNGKAVRLYSREGRDVTVIDANGIGGAYHAVQCVSGEDANTILEGFTITGGDASSPPPNCYGGGMFNNNSSPTVTNCIFSKNTGDSGGGMCNYNFSSPNVTNCTFSDNYAWTFGGGMCNENSSPTVTNCTFSGNRGDAGGGLYNYDSDPNVTDCNFSSNSALSGGGLYNSNSSPTVSNCSFGYNVADDSGGGGMCNNQSSPTVTNCTFSDNTAAGDGGGMYNGYNSSPTVSNCTFSDNTADANGGGMYNLDSSNATVANCILWGDTPDEIYNNSSSPVVTYCDVQGGTGQSWFGIGCIDADPCFMDAIGNDLRLLPVSLCIDAGDNNSVAADTADLDGDGNTVEPIPFDLKGRPRVVDGNDDGAAVVDMGAFEFQVIHNITQDTGYYTIQAAIDDANDGDEIEVAPRTYYEAIDFNGQAVRLYSREGQDVTTIDGTGNYHVVECVSGEDANTILEGFTITGGDADGFYPDDCGGGMFNYSSSPTVTNCSFLYNYADADGAGMYNEGGSPTVTNCSFSDNVADYYGGGMLNDHSSPTVTNCIFSYNYGDAGGGGMQNFTNSSPTVTNCTFNDNKALFWGDGGGISNISKCSGTVTNCTFSGNGARFGGGIYNFDSNPTVTNCAFRSNAANLLECGGMGGGMCNNQSNPTVTNCIFRSNFVFGTSMGGGMCNNQSSPTVTNCTFSYNYLFHGIGMGGGMYNYGLFSSPTVTNCILWNDSPDEIYDDANSATTVTYSDVEGGTGQSWFGTGCIDADPCFADANGGDLRLLPISLCIDAGDNDSVPADTADLDGDGNTVEPIPFDLDGQPRFIDGDCNDTAIVDMGAYEFDWVHIGDFAGGCDVDFADFAVFALAWLSDDTPTGNWNPDCDISLPPDGIINELDLKIFTENWLAGK